MMVPALPGLFLTTDLNDCADFRRWLFWNQIVQLK